MNKSELIEAMAESCEVTKAVASRLLESFMETITEELKTGDQVAIPGWGTFSIGVRAARTGRNPRTGEEIQIAAARVVKFKAGKALKEAVQEEA